MKSRKNSLRDPPQASFLRVNLNYLEEWNKRRKTIAEFYCQNLLSTDGIFVLQVAQDTDAVWQLYVIRHSKRDQFQEKINAFENWHFNPLSNSTSSFGGISGFWFPRWGLHIQRTLAQTVLSIPIGPHLSLDDAGYIIETIRDFSMGGFTEILATQISQNMKYPAQVAKTLFKLEEFSNYEYGGSNNILKTYFNLQFDLLDD